MQSYCPIWDRPWKSFGLPLLLGATFLAVTLSSASIMPLYTGQDWIVAVTLIWSAVGTIFFTSKVLLNSLHECETSSPDKPECRANGGAETGRTNPTETPEGAEHGHATGHH